MNGDEEKKFYKIANLLKKNFEGPELNQSHCPTKNKNTFFEGNIHQ